MDEGRFRADLFYRVNVFPIHLLPSERGVKTFHCSPIIFWSDSRTTEPLCRHRPRIAEAPRGLQLAWQHPSSSERHRAQCHSKSQLDTTLRHNEQELIDQALGETAGRVSGPSGAAARLGVPSSTLESKIRRLKIDKRRYPLTSA
jgi:transcriptional regulator with GAF, ATPase, and Fis domain